MGRRVPAIAPAPGPNTAKLTTRAFILHLRCRNDCSGDSVSLPMIPSRGFVEIDAVGPEQGDEALVSKGESVTELARRIFGS